ncbi:MAG: hypothetical protein ACXW2P_10030 [Thermoanaerobaculia bacterium]
MENRNRDKVSRNNESTTAGNVNRDNSSRQGNLDDDSTAEFGQKIDRSENADEANRRGEGIGDEGMRGDLGRSGSGGSVGEEIDRESTRNRDLEREPTESEH